MGRMRGKYIDVELRTALMEHKFTSLPRDIKLPYISDVNTIYIVVLDQQIHKY